MFSKKIEKRLSNFMCGFGCGVLNASLLLNFLERIHSNGWLVKWMDV